jgi:hypothetical protein
MKFVDLPEPHISSGHILARTPLLYRFDVRSDTGAIVVYEHQDRRPHIELNGDMAESRRLFYEALAILYMYGPNTPIHNVRGFLMPLFTLEIRPPMAFASGYEVILTGHSDFSVTSITHGVTPAIHLLNHVKAVHQRLTELGRVYYRT